MHDRVSLFAPFALRLRLPSRMSLGFFGDVLKWAVLWFIANALVSWGPHTPLGPGLVGIVFPLLVLEALLSARRRWRTRLFHMLQFCVPACSLLVLVELTPGSCCFCDQQPGARALRSVESFADFLYYNAIATLPALLVLALFGRPITSSIQGSAHVRALLSTFLATLLVTVWVCGSLALFKQQFVLLR